MGDVSAVYVIRFCKVACPQKVWQSGIKKPVLSRPLSGRLSTEGPAIMLWCDLQILFISGVTLTIGLQPTVAFFLRKKHRKVS